MMKRVFYYISVGLVIIGLIYILGLPIVLVFNLLKPFGYYAILFITIVPLIIGFFSTRYKITIIEFIANFSIKFLSSLYKEFLLQSVRYFYPNKEDKSFKIVVEVDLGYVKFLAFEVSQSNDYTVIFLPTSPNPTTGLIFHIPNEKVKKLSISPEKMMEYIISHGVCEI